MKLPVFFPFYNIYSDLVKTALGLKSNQSIDQFFSDAGLKVVQIGNKKCVICEDILILLKPDLLRLRGSLRYEAKSDFSKKIDELE
jgi:hypothetical protein